MISRNLRRTGAFALVPLAALSVVVVSVEANGRDGAGTLDARAAAATGAASGAASVAAGTPAQVPTAAAEIGDPVSATSSGARPARGAAATVGAGVVATPVRGRVGFVAASATSQAPVPATALAAYQRAASVVDQADTTCHLDWQLLAAIGRVESADGTTGGSALDTDGVATPAIYGPVLNGRHHTQRITDTDGGALDDDHRFDRAVGPLQILPATWLQIAVDGDGDGRRDPQDINDAALAAAVYLCAPGSDLSTTEAQQAALLRYNHSDAYAASVLAISSAYLTDASLSGSTAPVPASYLIPPALSDEPTAVPARPQVPQHAAAGSKNATATTRTGKKTKKAPKTGKHTPKHLTQHAGHPGVGTPPPAAPPSTPPGHSAPAPGASTSDTAPAAASTEELRGLCRNAIQKAYPHATEQAIDTATDRCATKLAGLTREEATARIGDEVNALDAAVAGLTPAAPDAPTQSPSTDPSPEPSGAASGDASNGAGAQASDAPAAG